MCKEFFSVDCTLVEDGNPGWGIVWGVQGLRVILSKELAGGLCATPPVISPRAGLELINKLSVVH